MDESLVVETAWQDYQQYTIIYFWDPGHTYLPTGYYPGSYRHEQLSTLVKYRLKDSTSTPNWRGIEKVDTTKFKPSKINLSVYLRRPTAPIFNPPRIAVRKKPLKPAPHVSPIALDLLTPSARKRQRKLSAAIDLRRLLKWRQKVKAWEIYDEKRLKRLKDYRTFFEEKRIPKFQAAVLRYQRRVDIVRKWQSRPKMSKTRSRLPPDNPYNEITLVPIGAPCAVGKTYGNIGWIEGGLPIYNGYSYTRTSASLDNVRSLLSGIHASIEPDRARAKAILSYKFYDKTARQRVHYANMIAERAQTIDLFRDAVLRLSSFLSAKRSFIKSLVTYARNPKAIANDILAFKFGIEPLIDDIKGTAEILATRLTSDDDIVIAIRTNRKTPLYFDRRGFKVAGLMESSYVVKYTVSNSFARTLQSFGFINSAEIAWEMTPWSFVFDWIVPISAYLNQLSAECGLTFKTGTYSERVQATVEVSSVYLVDGEDPYTSHYQVGGVYAYRRKFREVLTEPPEKMSLFVKNPLSWTHGLEALALTMQRIRFRKP